MTDLRVSLVMPVRDGARYLGEALASIAAQSRPVEELLVVDDGSVDDSATIAERAGATVLRQAGAGAGAARNRGIEAATGDVVVFADADDLLLPNKIEAQAAVLEADPDVDVVVARHVLLVEPGAEDLVPRVRDPFFGDLGGVEPLGTSMVRREVFDRVGLIAEDAGHGDGFEWASRARRLGVRSMIHPDPLYRRRIHRENGSHDRSTMQSDVVAALRRRITEGRAEAPRRSP